MTEVRLLCLMEPTWSHNIEIGKKMEIIVFSSPRFSLPKTWVFTASLVRNCRDYGLGRAIQKSYKNFTLNQKWNYARVSNPQYISPTFFHSFFPLVRKKFFFSRNGLTRPRSPTRGFWSTGSEMFPFQTAQNAAKTQRYLILFFWFLLHHDPSSK